MTDRRQSSDSKPSTTGLPWPPVGKPVGRLSIQSALLLKEAIHHATVLALGFAEPSCSVSDDEFDRALEFFDGIVSQFKLLPEEDDNGDETA